MSVNPTFNPSNPIPNNSFYSYPFPQICSTSGTLIVGENLFVDFSESTLNAEASGSIGVYEVNTGEGLTGGPILSIGTISLQSTGVAPGTYSHATINVDQYGRVRSASNGSAANTVTPGLALLATSGQTLAGLSSNRVVTPNALQSKVSNSVSCDSQNRIASAKAVKCAYDRAAAAIPCSAYLQKGILLAGSGNGTFAPLYPSSNGKVLVTDSNTETGLVWANNESISIPTNCISGKGSLITGSAEGQPVALPRGVDGQQLIVCDTCPFGIGWGSASDINAIKKSCIEGKGYLVAGASAYNPVPLGPGSEGQILSVCSTTTSGLKWVSPQAALSPSLVGSKGSLISGDAAGAPIALPLGTNGQILTANSACSSGLEWANDTSVKSCAFNAKGDLLVGSGAGAFQTLVAGSDNQFLAACVACPGGLTWANPIGAAIPCSCLIGKGALVTSTDTGLPFPLAVGADGYALVACSACTGGLTWTTVSGGYGIPCSLIDKGALITGTTANNPVKFPVGGDGCVLTACADSVCGLVWAPPPGSTSVPCSCYTALGTIVAGNGLSLPVTVPAPTTEGQVLTSCSACSGGMYWADIASTIQTLTDRLDALELQVQAYHNP